MYEGWWNCSQSKVVRITTLVYEQPLSWIRIIHWVSLPYHLFWTVRCNFLIVLQNTPTLIVESSGSKIIKKVLSVPKHNAFDFSSRKHLLEFHYLLGLTWIPNSNEICFHSINCHSIQGLYAIPISGHQWLYISRNPCLVHLIMT